MTDPGGAFSAKKRNEFSQKIRGCGRSGGVLLAQAPFQTSQHQRQAYRHDQIDQRQDRSFEKLLVPARQRANAEDEVRVREFKTANGLISFMQNIGFTHVNIPLKEGGRSTHVLPADALETDDD